MPQLHFSLPEDVAERLRRRADAAGLPLSRYIAEVVSRDVGDEWPAGYFEEVVGSWVGEPLQRPAPQEVERRDLL